MQLGADSLAKSNLRALDCTDLFFELYFSSFLFFSGEFLFTADFLVSGRAATAFLNGDAVRMVASIVFCFRFDYGRRHHCSTPVSIYHASLLLLCLL